MWLFSGKIALSRLIWFQGNKVREGDGLFECMKRFIAQGGCWACSLCHVAARLCARDCAALLRSNQDFDIRGIQSTTSSKRDCWESGPGKPGPCFAQTPRDAKQCMQLVFFGERRPGQGELWEEYLDGSQKFRLDSQEPRLPFAARLEGVWATKPGPCCCGDLELGGHRCLCISTNITSRGYRKRPVSSTVTAKIPARREPASAPSSSINEGP